MKHTEDMPKKVAKVLMQQLGVSSVLNESKRQEKFKKVMGEFYRGQLHSGSKKGKRVRKRSQALAIAQSEAENVNESLLYLQEEIRNNLIQKLNYIYENYGEGAAKYAYDQLTEEEQGILGEQGEGGLWNTAKSFGRGALNVAGDMSGYNAFRQGDYRTAALNAATTLIPGGLAVKGGLAALRLGKAAYGAARAAPAATGATQTGRALTATPAATGATQTGRALTATPAATGATQTGRALTATPAATGATQTGRALTATQRSRAVGPSLRPRPAGQSGLSPSADPIKLNATNAPKASASSKFDYKAARDSATEAKLVGKDGSMMKRGAVGAAGAAALSLTDTDETKTTTAAAQQAAKDTNDMGKNYGGNSTARPPKWANDLDAPAPKPPIAGTPTSPGIPDDGAEDNPGISAIASAKAKAENRQGESQAPPPGNAGGQSPISNSYGRTGMGLKTVAGKGDDRTTETPQGRRYRPETGLSGGEAIRRAAKEGDYSGITGPGG